MFDWLQGLVEWLRNTLGVAGKTEPRWLERWIAIDGHIDRDDARVFNIPDTEALLLCNGQNSNSCPIPGVVALWEIKHLAALNNLILICVNAAQLKESPQGEHDRHWQRSFEKSARMALQAQKNINYSHVFMVGWVSKTPVVHRTKIVAGRAMQEAYHSIICTACIACDLQGVTRPWLGDNKAAERVVRAIAMRLLAITPSDYSSWEETVRTLDTGKANATWLSWLHYFACENTKTRVAAGHILQPPRASLKQLD